LFEQLKLKSNEKYEGMGGLPTVELFEWVKTLYSLENFKRQGKTEIRKMIGTYNINFKIPSNFSGNL